MRSKWLRCCPFSEKNKHKISIGIESICFWQEVLFCEDEVEKSCFHERIESGMSIIRVVKKFNYLLSKRQKIRVIEMTFLMIIGGFLETLSISIILSFMDMVMDAETTMEKYYVRIICDIFSIHDSRTFLLLVAVVLALLYIIKNVYLILEYNIQYRFVYGNMFLLQKRLLSNLIHRPYEYFLKVNSGELLRVMNNDTPQTYALLQGLLSMVTELIVSSMLIIAIFMITPITTFCIAVVLLLLLLVINFYLKPILQKASKEYQCAVTGMNKCLLQSIQGIKELKVMSKEDFFQDQFDKYGEKHVNAIRRYQILGILPRFFIEAISMAAMFVVIAVMIYIGTAFNQLVPIISAIAMAAIRLLPSINRISGGMSTIAYYEPMLDKLKESIDEISVNQDLYDSTEEKSASKRKVVNFSESIELSGICFHYPDREENIFSNAGFTIRYGESVGIVGSSGAGKSTAVDIILGLLKPQKGQILIDGTDICEDMKGWLDQIGYIPQTIFLLDDTIRSNVAFGTKKGDISEEQIWKALEGASLADFVRGLPRGLDTEIGERGVRLSGGQRQRIGIARALYREPGILIFDEATSALDNQTETEIVESIQRLHGHKTMIIIAHRLTTIEACDHIYRVEKEKIIIER